MSVNKARLTLESQRRKRAEWTPEQREKHNADCRRRRKQQRQDPKYREKYLARDRESNKKRDRKESDHLRHSKPENKEKKRARELARYNRLKDDPVFRESRRQMSRNRYKEKPYEAVASCRLRQAQKLLATPRWLTKEMRRQMADIYKEAKRLSVTTGVVHHVDHIDPLRGKWSCGLHVPWNLQILTGVENLKKANKIDPHFR